MRLARIFLPIVLLLLLLLLLPLLLSLMRLLKHQKKSMTVELTPLDLVAVLKLHLFLSVVDFVFVVLRLLQTTFVAARR